MKRNLLKLYNSLAWWKERFVALDEKCVVVAFDIEKGMINSVKFLE